VPLRDTTPSCVRSPGRISHLASRSNKNLTQEHIISLSSCVCPLSPRVPPSSHKTRVVVSSFHAHVTSSQRVSRVLYVDDFITKKQKFKSPRKIRLYVKKRTYGTTRDGGSVFCFPPFLFPNPKQNPTRRGLGSRVSGLGGLGSRGSLGGLSRLPTLPRRREKNTEEKVSRTIQKVKETINLRRDR
jgi:hypothetical protein